MANVKMEIANANVNSFKSIFNSLNTIVDTLTFECYQDRVEINALDKSHTVFISCVMGNSYFCSYECNEEDRFGIDTTEFRKIVKSCKDSLILEFDNEAVIINSNSKTFKIFQVNDDLNTPKPPEMEYFVSFEIPISFLKSMLKDIELFAKVVTLKSSGNQVSFSCEGTSGKFNETYTVDDDFSLKKVSISTEKFATCIASDKVSDNVELQIETDSPLILKQSAEGIKLNYLIAPRIDVSE